MRGKGSPDRGVRGSGHHDDDWIPLAWNDPSPQGMGGTAKRWMSIETEPGSPIEPEPELTIRPLAGGLVLGMALAPFVAGFFSLIFSAIGFIGGSDGVPRGIVLLLFIQAGVAFGLALIERGPLIPSWITSIICSAVLLPLLAIQVALLREPYVSWSRGSASPALVATVVVGMVIVAGAVWAAASNWEHPDEAGLLFMPQALMVPALVGIHATINQAPALRMFGTVMLLTAAATALSWLLQPSERIFLPPAALAVEVVGLWMSGHGPRFHSTSGDVVRLLYGVMLAVSVILVVMVPIAAMWVNHGASFAEEMRVKRELARGTQRSSQARSSSHKFH